MSKLCSRMLQSAKEASAYSQGNGARGFTVHHPVDVRALRKRMGLNQPEFAARFGLAVGTLRDWEQGRSQPDRPAQTLLRVIEREPEAVLRAMETTEA